MRRSSLTRRAFIGYLAIATPNFACSAPVVAVALPDTQLYKVHRILASYQIKESGGNRWLRIMTFVPEEDRIYVTTYSCWLK
jgi:hypothetical protein